MKYCSKCGKELFDEAVVCPGCGCPVQKEGNLIEVVKNSKIKTALILNIFSLVIMIFAGFIYAGLTVDTFGDAFKGLFSDPVVYRLVGLVALCFVAFVVNFIFYKKNTSKNIFTWIYIACVVILVGYFAIYSPLYFFTTICGSGILFPVPVVLQIIAAVKTIQATK